MSNKLIVCRASAGTGKTYTLAARYIALLMDSDTDFLYRHILAVTFTNKATAEMKQRILSYLFMIAEGGNESQREGFIKTVKGFMTSTNKSDEYLQKKADRIYHNILGDYDNMKVSTIDSFLQTLITGMAHMLGIGAGFNVVLDSKHVISTAVDEVMTTHINETPEAKNMLVEYVEEKLGDEQKWDIRANIIRMVTEVMKESVLKDDNDIVLDAQAISNYRKALQDKFYADIAPFKSKCKKLCELFKYEATIDNKYINAFLKHIIEIGKSNVIPKDELVELSNTGSNELNSDKFPSYVPTNIDSDLAKQLLLDINDCILDIKAKYILYDITIKYLNDLRMMGVVKTRIDNTLDDTNSILLARTAYVLSKALKPGDADFILEKAGIRYQHIMIDEFQDTSTLQWHVFRELISEVLSNCGSTLIVGDVKQSIYRWRNGDYRIMAEMNTETPQIGSYYDTTTQPLARNFRSQSNIVRFNLGIFKQFMEPGQVAEKLTHLYHEGKEGSEGYTGDNLRLFHNKEEDAGFVQFKVFPYIYGNGRKTDTEAQKQLKSAKVKEDLVDQMFKDICNLLDNDAKQSDILILIRKNREITDIINGYQRSSIKERGIKICSNDSFVLQSSQSVLTIINCLKVLHNKDSIAKQQLQIKNIDTAPLSNCDPTMPLYELTESIVREVLCDENGLFRYDDIPFVNCFMDSMRNYVDSYGSDIKSFITYWNDELRQKAIPASGNEGIRIMTIHSSKGLESKNLFIPFCNWDLSTTGNTLWVKAHGNIGNTKDVKDLGLIPVKLSSDMVSTPYEPYYNKEIDAQLIDNLNLLYVALTRAADNLFIYAPLLRDTLSANKLNNVGACLLCALRNKTATSGRTLEEDFNVVFDQCKEGDVVYAEYTLGDQPYIQADEEKESFSPFEYYYTDADKCKYDFYSTSKNITFRQSQESILYNQEAPDKAESIQQRIDAGILRHNILSEIKTMADTDKVINKYYTKGIIETQAQADAIKAELTRAWQTPEMRDWFGGSWQLLREVTILVPNAKDCTKKELRPDRVMIKGNKAVVLDFKFGKQNHDKYSEQVQEYMNVLRTMGYTDVTGYLWYGFDNELVKI